MSFDFISLVRLLHVERHQDATTIEYVHVGSNMYSMCSLAQRWQAQRHIISM